MSQLQNEFRMSLKSFHAVKEAQKTAAAAATRAKRARYLAEKKKAKLTYDRAAKVFEKAELKARKAERMRERARHVMRLAAKALNEVSFGAMNREGSSGYGYLNK